MFRHFILALLFLLPAASLPAQLFSSDLQKGFKAIEKNNYDKAIELFNDILKSDSSDAGAHYGLAAAYFSKDYSGFSAEKAYRFIRTAQQEFPQQDHKQQAALAHVGVDQSKLDALRQKIDDELFSAAVAANSTEAYDQFIRAYPDNANVAQARELREQLAFYQAHTSNSPDAIDEYIKSNPNGKDVQKAISMRNLLAFRKAKAANTEEALQEFLQKYPDAKEAEDAKAALASLAFLEVKKKNTLQAYDEFLAKYPEAEEVAEATQQRNQLAYIQLLEEEKQRDAAVIDKKNADYAKQSMQLNLFIVGSLALLVLAGLLYRGYRQKKLSNKKITHQKEIIEQKNKEIVDSINYAKRIQESLLPMLEDIRKNFPESFVFFRPRDIVSGDFYWFARQDNRLYIAAADCTGHGVPGALVSMVGFNFLNQLVSEMNISEVGEILNRLHEKISLTLNKDIDHSQKMRDGMDIALLCFDQAGQTLTYAGAVRPLFFIDEEGPKTIKGSFYSVGGIKSLTGDPFETHVVPVKGKTSLYLFSDGYADQFGGPQGKKFKMKKLQELLLSLQHKNMEEQHDEVEKTFVDWMGNNEQVDDVCMLGVRI